MYRLIAFLMIMFAATAATAPQRADRPVRVAIARLTHGHVGGLLGRRAIGDVEIVGIYEPDRAVAARYVRDYHSGSAGCGRHS